MSWYRRRRESLRGALDNFRLRVSRAEALSQLSILGIITGVIAGVAIILLRTVIEFTQAAFLPDANPENYEALAPVWRVVVPLTGGMILGLLFHLAPEAGRHVGVVHVLERLAYHQGQLPLRNAIMQFIGAVISIVSGHSVGREGPPIHLGAASGSLPGQKLGLPNNSLRVLVGCGVAAAIAASL